MLSCDQCSKSYINEIDFLRGTRDWKVCSEGNLWLRCQCKAQLKISKGEFSWYSPEKALTSESASIFNTLSQKGRLPHISTSIMELQLKLADESTDSKSLVDAIKTDPTIAAEILSLASTMKLGTDTKINSLQHAVSFIGRDAIMNISLIAAIKTFEFSCRNFDQEKYWGSMKVTGIISEALARKFAPEVEPDLAYLTGSLCNIGKAVGAICLPENTDKVYDKSIDPKSKLTWIAAEAALDVPNHQLLGEIACVLWGFPEEVSTAARFHHDLEKLQKLEKLEVLGITALANQLCHWIESEPEKIDQEILDLTGKLAGLGDAEIESFIKEMKNIMPVI